MALMSVLSAVEGDIEFKWDPDSNEVDTIMDAFDEYVSGKKYLAYRVNEDGTKDRIYEFDLEAGHIVLTPPRAGG